MERRLHIDIETYSEASIADCGVYRYAMDPSFRILLVAYALGDEPTQVVDLASGEPLPAWMLRALTGWNRLTTRPHETRYTMTAHNAVFERVCFTVHLRRLGLLGPDEWLTPEGWDCTMIKAARCGLPHSLAQVGEVLGLEQQKMSEGKALIRLFCTPHPEKDGEIGMDGLRVTPDMYPDKWQVFKDYCVRDVDVERGIDKACSWYPVSDFERMLYWTDQRINDRGVLVDLDLASKAARMNAVHVARLSEEAQQLTGLGNPNSVSQLKAWIGQRTGRGLDALNKTVLADLVKDGGLPDDVKRVLQIRAEMGKTSNAKYGAMLSVACPDGRARGLTQFYGSRTGRWAGRLIQMQNLPQNHIGSLDAARRYAKAGNYEMLELGYGNVPDTLSQLIRTAFIAPEDRTLAVCDFSAIEARVLAWEAGEDWVLDVFRSGGDIYCATASQMFHVPVEKHGQNAHLRQKGKVAVLALGYQGGVGALDKMGGARLGMTEQEEKDTVEKWRRANPSIVTLWGQYESAAKRAVIRGEEVTVGKGVVFRMEGRTMTVQLPSGRRICYPEMQFTSEGSEKWKYKGSWGGPDNWPHYEKEARLRFRGLNQTTRKWEWVETYGGKITENITQAIARDCLAETMVRCEDAGFPVVFHVHDELVTEVKSEDRLKEIQEIFSVTPSWAAGLPLRGAGYCTPYYLKD